MKVLRKLKSVIIFCLIFAGMYFFMLNLLKNPANAFGMTKFMAYNIRMPYIIPALIIIIQFIVYIIHSPFWRRIFGLKPTPITVPRWTIFAEVIRVDEAGKNENEETQKIITVTFKALEGEDIEARLEPTDPAVNNLTVGEWLVVYYDPENPDSVTPCEDQFPETNDS